MLPNIFLGIANFGQSSLIVQSKISHTNFTLLINSFDCNVKPSLRIFYGRHHDLVNYYRLSVSQMTT